MPLEDFLKVLDELKSRNQLLCPHIQLTGGEPLLRADLEQCGMEFHRRGCSWGIDTNGILLTPGRMFGFVDSGLVKVTIKLNGLENVQNWYWGSNLAFSKTIQSISMIQSFSLVDCEVETRVSRENVKQLPKLKTLLVEMKVKKWNLYTCRTNSESDFSNGNILRQEEYLELLDFVQDERKKGDIDVHLSSDGFMGRYELLVREEPFFCRAGVEQAAILADGSISGGLDLEPEFSQGNIYTDSFANVWNNGFSLLRNREWTRQGVCKECEYFVWCQGNAMYLRNGKTGTIRKCTVNEYNL
jgi:radical SAM protein with 4Fe4S-binding SPASM domain